METEVTFDSRQSDELLNEGLSDFTDSRPTAGHSARDERLEEHETLGLQQASTREALLASATATVADIAFIIGDVVKESLSAMPGTAENIAGIAPLLNDHRRYLHQMERFMQLEIRLEASRIQAQQAQSRSHSSLLAHRQQLSQRPR